MEHPENFFEAFLPSKPPRTTVAIVAHRYGRRLLRTFVLTDAFVLAGNTQQLTGRHTNEWNKHLAETHGPLSKLAGPFSVSNGISPSASGLYISSSSFMPPT